MEIAWETPSAEPVAVPGQINGEYDSQGMATGNVVQVGDRYRLYYWGRGRDDVNRICWAEAPVDVPNAWEGRGAVLGPQPDTDYNCDGPVIPAVLPREEGPWLMYLGTCGKPKVPGTFHWYSGLATSEDEGVTWEYVTQEPLIPPEAPYDQVGTGTLFVVRERAQYRMYYTCCSGYEDVPAMGNKSIVGIGYAVSDDGVHWSKPFDDFLIAPRRDQVAPYEWWIAKPLVLSESDGAYRMWVSCSGEHYRIFSLTSTDGVSWTWVPAGPDGDLGIGPPGSFDDAQRSYAAVVKKPDRYLMWFSGNGYGATGMGFAIGR